jgi:hypothetical protein
LVTAATLRRRSRPGWLAIPPILQYYETHIV